MKFVWPESARSDLRGIDREMAIRILHALTRFGDCGEGDVKALAGEWQGYSGPRVGDYRVMLSAGPDEITVIRVRHARHAGAPRITWIHRGESPRG